MPQQIGPEKRVLGMWDFGQSGSRATFREEVITTEQSTPKRKRYPTLTGNSAVALNRRRAGLLTGFTGHDPFVTRIVMQPCLHGCSILPSWREKTEISVLTVEWHSICEAEFSLPDQFLV